MILTQMKMTGHNEEVKSDQVIILISIKLYTTPITTRTSVKRNVLE